MTDGRIDKVRVITAALFFTIILTSMIPSSGAIGWSKDEQLTTDTAWDMTPAIMQTRNGTIWVVWTSDRIQLGRYDLFYKTSSNEGASWSNPTRITWHPSTDETPAIIQTQDKNIWLVWASQRTGNKEVFYKIYFDNMQYWSTVTQLTNNASEDTAPSIIQSLDGTICVVWQRNVTKTDGSNFEIFCKTSSDYGVTWSNETRVTTDPGWDMNPSVTYLANGTLLVVFCSYRADSNFEIFSKTSDDNGLSWSGANRLTTDTANNDANPSVVQDVNGTIWVVWAKELAIYYKTSPFPSTDTQLSKLGDNTSPSVICSNERKMWVVWESTRVDWDIYYKISDEIPYVHDLAVLDIIAWGGQGVPITFVPRSIPVSINVTIENQGHFAETFNVTAYAERNAGDVFIHIETQYNIPLAAGANTTVTLTWNTTDAPYGTYYISANATIVPGERDVHDNILIHGAKIGGISVPWQPQTNILPVLIRLASVILIILALGAFAITFFKALMSVQLPRPWRLRVNSTTINPRHR